MADIENLSDEESSSILGRKSNENIKSGSGSARNLPDSSEYETLHCTGGALVDETSSDSEIEETTSKYWNNVLGICFVFGAAIAYTFYSLVCKYLLSYRSVPYTQMVICRSVVTWVVTFSWLSWLKYKNRGLPFFGNKEHRIWLFLRSLFLFAGNFLWMWSLIWLSPGDSDTIWQIQAFWVLLGAHYFLKEKMDLMSWLCVIIGLSGIVMVAQPSFIFGGDDGTSGWWREVGIILVISSSLSSASCVLVTRAIALDVDWLQFEFVTATLATFVFIPVVFTIYFLYHWISIRNASVAIGYIWNNNIYFTDWLLCLSLGLIGFFATASLTRGVQLSVARFVSIILYSEIPLAYIGQVIFYHMYANVYTWVGAVLVLLAAMVPSIRIILSKSQPKGTIKDPTENLTISMNQGKAVNETPSISKSLDSCPEIETDENIPLLKNKDTRYNA